MINSNLMVTNEFHGDLRRKYANMSFFRFWFVLGVGKAFHHFF